MDRLYLRNDRAFRLRLIAAALLAIALVVPLRVPTSTAQAAGPGQSRTVTAPLRPWLDPTSEAGRQETDPIPLDLFIRTQMALAHMPGLSAVIVKNGRIVWSGAYGYSRINDQSPVTGDTLFELASVSKTVIATAVMQLWETGRLGLDTDINTYLPFPVVNPNFPDVPITARMLMAHTSSIIDNDAVFIKEYRPGDPTIALGAFLEDYLTPGGSRYDPERNFAMAAPGTVWSYSNFGASLAAYLVEAITGLPFDQYCNAFIFEPLGMTETSYRFEDLDTSEIAMPYGYSRFTGLYHPYGFYGCPLYPAGWVITSAGQLARHLIAFMQNGEVDGVRVLQPETVAEMRRIQYPELAPQFGLFWYTKNLRGWQLMGHNGGNFGVATEMFFRLEDSVGVILLMNGDWTSLNIPIVYNIEARLFRESDKY
jgi:CubicO group peptidase (beta-lactamase class C family)